MLSSHGRSRRHSDSNGEDDEAALTLLVSRVDEPRTDAYSRPSKTSHHTEHYRASSTSSRASYDAGRDASSRTFRDADDWGSRDVSHSSHDRYTYSPSKDSHRSGGRDAYDTGEPRNTDVWPSRINDDHYTSSRREWTQRYDHGRPTSSHPDWNPPSSYGNRTPTFEQWQPEDNRSRSADEQKHGRVMLEDRHSDRDTPGWSREERHDDGGQTWRRDWDSGSRDSRGKGWNETRRWNGTRHEDSQRSADDRSWEPAATWQPSSRDTQSQRNQNSKNSHSHKNSKGGRKGHHNKQKRDWRTDDGNLNNWQKRDVHYSSSKAIRTPTKRRHPHSPSRSHSRSPAESYRSRHSSRGLSRSRSGSPKRTWRDSSPAAARNGTPSERGRRKARKPRPVRTFSKSPSSPRRSRDSAVTRRRSVSSSSTSRSRSTSRSPADRPRAVHRLPPATSLTDIPLSSINLSRSTGMRPPRDIPPHRNGKNQVNGKHVNRPFSSGSYHSLSTRAAVVQPSSVSAMPPPPIPVPPVDTPSFGSSGVSRSSDAPESIVDTTTTFKGSRSGIKNAGFRPIGQNPAVKKFFPADDDEVDVIPDRHLESVTLGSSHSQKPTCEVQDPSQRERDDQQSATLGRPEQPSIHQHSNKLSSRHHEIRGAPSPSNKRSIRVSLQDNSQPPKDSRKDSWHTETATPTWPPQIPDREANEVTRPSTPSGGSPCELYAIISQVGEGTFGKVYKARNTVTKVHVALKRIRMEAERDGFPVTAMREIKLLQSLRHGNVVRLYEMMVSNGSAYMVFEYMDHDLTGILSQTQFSFTDAHLKSLCQQMLAGLAYLHHKGVIHRDIKGSNILINNRGELKLADFGLARFYQKRRRSDYTNRVITLWYRPPELLFGATVYGPEVDMWSAGCIMLELFTKKPVFQGNDEIHQLEVIYKIIGTPTPERWIGVADLPWYELVKPREAVHNHFRELFQKWLSPAALDLAEILLAYDPAKRVTAVQALEAPYFIEEEPSPALPVGLSTLEGEWHELETKRERAKKRRKTEPVMQ